MPGPWEMWWKEKTENEGKLKDLITKRDYDNVKKLIKDAYARPSINTKYEDGQTPLHWACLTSDHKIIALLIKNNANVNACNKLMRSPLHYACQIGGDLYDNHKGVDEDPPTLKTVKLFLEFGANPNIKDKSGKYPYQHAKDQAVMEYLKMHTGEEDDYEELRYFYLSSLFTILKF